MLCVSLVILIYGSVIIIIIISSYITHSTALNTWPCAVIVCCRMVVIACLEAQVLSHEDGQDSSQVFHCGPVHPLLRIIQCVPEHRKWCGDQVKHRYTWFRSRNNTNLLEPLALCCLHNKSKHNRDMCITCILSRLHYHSKDWGRKDLCFIML